MLIVEDDADWDVALKQQLITIANLTRNIENRDRALDDQLDETTPTSSPYGTSWDIIWFGTCVNSPVAEDALYMPSEDGQGKIGVWKEKKDGMLCTYGYAISLKGAEHLLGFVMDTDQPIDWALSDFCAEAECITMWPQLISQYLPAGPMSAESDTHAVEGWRVKGETPAIHKSAIVNALERTGGTRLWNEMPESEEMEQEAENQ